MGNQQSKKNGAEVQPIKDVVVELKQVAPKEDSFVKEIQHENERNVKQRKSIAPPPDQTVAPVITTNPPPRHSKKELSKKELPPLKLKNASSMKSTPLGNCQNVTNKQPNGVEELEEVQCDKGQKAGNPNEPGVGEMDDRQLEDQKQNNEAAMNVRAKKFRPSQNSSKKTTIASNISINDARHAIEIGQIKAV